MKFPRLVIEELEQKIVPSGITLVPGDSQTDTVTDIHDADGTVFSLHVDGAQGSGQITLHHNEVPKEINAACSLTFEGDTPGTIMQLVIRKTGDGGANDVVDITKITSDVSEVVSLDLHGTHVVNIGNGIFGAQIRNITGDADSKIDVILAVGEGAEVHHITMAGSIGSISTIGDGASIHHITVKSIDSISTLHPNSPIEYITLLNEGSVNGTDLETTGDNSNVFSITAPALHSVLTHGANSPIIDIYLTGDANATGSNAFSTLGEYSQIHNIFFTNGGEMVLAHTHRDNSFIWGIYGPTSIQSLETEGANSYIFEIGNYFPSVYSDIQRIGEITTLGPTSDVSFVGVTGDIGSVVHGIKATGDIYTISVGGELWQVEKTTDGGEVGHEYGKIIVGGDIDLVSTVNNTTVHYIEATGKIIKIHVGDDCTLGLNTSIKSKNPPDQPTIIEKGERCQIVLGNTQEDATNLNIASLDIEADDTIEGTWLTQGNVGTLIMGDETDVNLHVGGDVGTVEAAHPWVDSYNITLLDVGGNLGSLSGVATITDLEVGGNLGTIVVGMYSLHIGNAAIEVDGNVGSITVHEYSALQAAIGGDVTSITMGMNAQLDADVGGTVTTITALNPINWYFVSHLGVGGDITSLAGVPQIIDLQVGGNVGTMTLGGGSWITDANIEGSVGAIHGCDPYHSYFLESLDVGGNLGALTGAYITNLKVDGNIGNASVSMFTNGDAKAIDCGGAITDLSVLGSLDSFAAGGVVSDLEVTGNIGNITMGNGAVLNANVAGNVGTLAAVDANSHYDVGILDVGGNLGSLSGARNITGLEVHGSIPSFTASGNIGSLTLSNGAVLNAHVGGSVGTVAAMNTNAHYNVPLLDVGGSLGSMTGAGTITELQAGGDIGTVNATGNISDVCALGDIEVVKSLGVITDIMAGGSIGEVSATGLIHSVVAGGNIRWVHGTSVSTVSAGGDIAIVESSGGGIGSVTAVGDIGCVNSHGGDIGTVITTGALGDIDFVLSGGGDIGLVQSNSFILHVNPYDSYGVAGTVGDVVSDFDETGDPSSRNYICISGAEYVPEFGSAAFYGNGWAGGNCAPNGPDYTLNDYIDVFVLLNNYESAWEGHVYVDINGTVTETTQLLNFTPVYMDCNGDGQLDTCYWEFDHMSLNNIMGGQAGRIILTSTITGGGISETHSITINVVQP